MKTEIGGYLEFEELSGKEYYPDLYRVNLGRTALLWLLESRRCRRLLLPYFLCDSVIGACEASGVSVSFYTLNELLEPQLSDQEGSPLPENTWLYLVNYYGQLTDERILALKRRFGQVIVDHTHAFFQRPLPGVDTLYSCRKFFGLSDGAYLSTDAALTPGHAKDQSHTRMGHILGRYEAGARPYYQAMLENAAEYHHMEIRTMSRLTENLLRGIDYERVRTVRTDNYRLLKELLPSDNPFTRIEPAGPFAYPYAHPNGIALRKRLAARNIFVPTNWGNVLKDCPPDSPEYQWAANVLPLPCDQRYGPEEMQLLAQAVQEEGRDLT